ncbi:MAG: DUF4097 family beta strand repeat-containing protein [Acidobacteriota bacterium]
MTPNPNPNRSGPLGVLVALVLVAAMPALATAAERQWSQSYPLGDGGRVSLSNINGNVVIEGTDGAEVVVDATLTGDAETVDAIEIAVDASADRVSIETVYPRTRRGSWGRKGGGSVEYRLQVPRGVELDEISLVNGSLELEGITGEVEASLVNGSLTARGLAGNAELSTVNGALEVYVDRLGGGQDLELDSVNGSIDLYLPSSADADLDASTVHGRIRNDFGIEVKKGEWVGASMRGQVGSGAASVSLETVNGSIEVHRD